MEIISWLTVTRQSRITCRPGKISEQFFISIKLPLNNLKEKALFAGRFFHFILHSGNRYGVHSPFLYKLTGDVLRKDPKIPSSVPIESLRKECMGNREVIQKTDYGMRGAGPEGARYPVSIREIAGSSLTPPRLARRLFRLASYFKATRILEIGTSLGITTAYLAIASPSGKVVTLEGCPELSRLAREHFHRLGLENIEVVEGRFEDGIQSALTQFGTVDLVYIDGNHRKEALLDYFSGCLKFIHNDTVIICDDIHSSGEMEEAWEEIIRRPEVTVTLDLFFNGWIFFRKESSREHFRLRYV